MKIHLIIFTAICFVTTGCTQAQECVENINKLPMYGSVKKCKEQIQADKEFLTFIDNSHTIRKDAAAHMVTRGWQYYYKNQLDTAMMRFNQAWLLIV